MHRLQVQLTKRQEQALRELSRVRKVSISALIREGVDALIAPRERYDDELKAGALAILGKFRSGQRDVSKRHDAYFAEAIAQGRRKR